MEPDSKVFEHWAALDSLPDTYVSTRIEVIDFKGINLVWRWNYRQLHFNTFEIRSPEVRVYGSSGSNPLVSGLAADTVEHAESKTLYEVISPYIDALSVKTLNLENASISYNVENQVSPIIYTLNNVSSMRMVLCWILPLHGAGSCCIAITSILSRTSRKPCW